MSQNNHKLLADNAANTANQHQSGSSTTAISETDQESIRLAHHLRILDLAAEWSHRDAECCCLASRPGTWALEFALANPEAKVDSIIPAHMRDLVPRMVPRNLEFVVDDIFEEWNYRHTYHFIHLFAGSLFSLRESTISMDMPESNSPGVSRLFQIIERAHK